MTFADDLIAAHLPWMTDDLRAYLAAIGSMWEELELYAADDDEPDEPQALLYQENLTPNPNFEYDSTNLPPAFWATVSSTDVNPASIALAVIATRVTGSNQACNLAGTHTGPNAQIVAQHNPQPATPGSAWSATATFSLGLHTDATVQVVFYDALGGLLSVFPSPPGPFAGAGGWGGTARTPTVIAPLGTDTVAAQIVLRATAGGDVSGAFDNVGLFNGPSPSRFPNGYADGDTAGWQWLGVPGQSASAVIPKLPNVGWSRIFDVNRATTQGLPFLAQVVGERLPASISDSAARDWIRRTPNQNRGQLAAIVQAVQRTLTGSKTVFTKERAKIDGTVDANWLAILTYSHETPNTSWIQGDLRTVVPADINVDYATSIANTWGAVKATYSTWSAVRTAVPSWGALNHDILGQIPLGYTVWTA